MITSLLALALAVAPDSLSMDSAAPAATLAKDSVQLAVPPVASPAPCPIAPTAAAKPAVRSADDLDAEALDRISPIPFPSPFAEATKIDSAPIIPPLASGFGFRALGPTTSANVFFGDPQGIFLRLVGTGSSVSDGQEETSARLPGRKVQSSRESDSWEGQVQIGRVLGCRESVCALGSVGVLGGYEVTTMRTLEPFYPGISSQHERVTRFGGVATAGLRWEFVEGIALASELGFKVVHRFGNASSSVSIQRTGDVDDIYETSGRIDGSELGFQFLGIGLDAWF